MHRVNELIPYFVIMDKSLFSESYDTADFYRKYNTLFEKWDRKESGPITHRLLLPNDLLDKFYLPPSHNINYLRNKLNQKKVKEKRQIDCLCKLEMANTSFPKTQQDLMMKRLTKKEKIEM